MFDFLGIGAQKAGTTWLHTQLKQHPDVWMPLAKELHFFDSIHMGYSNRRVFRQIQRMAGAQIVETLEEVESESRSSGQWKKIAFLARLAKSREAYTDKWYKFVFTRISEILDKTDSESRSYHWKMIAYLVTLSDGRKAYTDEWYKFVFTGLPTSRVKGEITPLYCSIGPAGVKHVKKLNPRVKLIYLIRDPMDRAMSSLRMRAEKARKSLDKIVSEKLFIARCDYLHDVRCWDEHFGDQVLYIPFGLIKSQPDEVMRRVEKHLGVPAFGTYERLTDQVHTTNREVNIPRDIVARLEEIVEPQYCFLEQRFGASFLEDTK